jgi:hypothetical protein
MSSEIDLKETVAVVRDILKGEYPNLTVNKRDVPRTSESGGWWCTVARLGKDLPDVEVFLDHLSGAPDRRFWYGISRKTNFDKATLEYFEKFNILPPRGERDRHKNGKEYFAFKQPLKKREFGRPLLETYGKEQHFGFYAAPETPIEDILNFLRILIESFLPPQTLPAEFPKYQSIWRLSRDRQPIFRHEMISAYKGTCAISGCKTIECLEAAHVDQYAISLNDQPENGLLLRADLHRLFDAGLITLEWSKAATIVQVHHSISDKAYRALHGAPLLQPAHGRRPAKEFIERHAAASQAQRDT